MTEVASVTLKLKPSQFAIIQDALELRTRTQSYRTQEEAHIPANRRAERENMKAAEDLLKEISA